MSLKKEEFLKKLPTLHKLILESPYIPHDPFANQIYFLSLDVIEALYGGAAGGGKSDALLMAALMYAHVPHYNAIIFRRTYTDLNLPEAIMARSHEWLGDTDAKWNGSDYRWTFPSGATLSFGYLNSDKDKYRYQSSAFQFIGFDELTQFASRDYLYLFSRLRKSVTMDVPLRMRSGSNPGGIGHHWVFERFVAGDRPFVPSSLNDNPHIDRDEYRRSLSELDDTTRKQLEDGLWILDPGNKPFQRDWWRGQNRYVGTGDAKLSPIFARFISWDTALEDKEGNAYSAYVVGELLNDYRIRVREVWRDRVIFPELPEIITAVANRWDFDDKLRGVIVEGKASGKPAIQSIRASMDRRVAKLIREYSPKGNKLERASRAGVWAKRGMVEFPYPSEFHPWLPIFEAELFNFPESEYADQVDAFSQLIIFLENYLASGWQGDNYKRKPYQYDNRVKRALNK